MERQTEDYNRVAVMTPATFELFFSAIDCPACKKESCRARAQIRRSGRAREFPIATCHSALFREFLLDLRAARFVARKQLRRSFYKEYKNAGADDHGH